MDENRKFMFLSYFIKRIDAAFVWIEVIIRRIKFYSFCAHFNIFSKLWGWLTDQGRINSAKRKENIITLAKIHDIFIRDNTGSKRAYFRQNHGPFDFMALR